MYLFFLDVNDVEFDEMVDLLWCIVVRIEGVLNVLFYNLMLYVVLFDSFVNEDY